MTDVFAEVAVAGFSQKPGQLLTYKIPGDLLDRIQVGGAVKVPLRQREVYGWILKLNKTSDRPALKTISQAVGPGPLLTDLQLDLARWLAKRYLAFYTGCLETIFPTTWLKQPKHLAAYQNKVFGCPGPDRPAGLGFTQTLIQYGSENKALNRVSELALETRAKGRQVLILVPAVSQIDRLIGLVDRSRADTAKIFHSGLPVRQKMALYFDLLSTPGPDLICGTRQALFLPWNDLGLIILHQEHDDSYQQQANPHYDAREVARYLAEKLQIPLVLTSPAPSCDVYQDVLAKKTQRLFLPAEKKSDFGLISPAKIAGKYLEPLRDQLNEVLASGGRAIFYLNRRGWAPVIYCPTCRKSLRCPSCSVNLSYQAQTGRYLCHHCGYAAGTPLTCPVCGQKKLRFLGWGTERLTQLLQKSYPGVPVLRLDSDTAKNQKAVDKTARRFSDSQPVVMVATALISQISDRPAVDLLAIAEADQLLSQADFQSAERLWRVIKGLTAVWRPAHCLVMTEQPQHHLFQALTSGRDQDFYARELELRQQLNYPPSAVLASVVISGKSQEKTLTQAKQLAERWRQQSQKKSAAGSGLTILGPAAAPLARIKGQTRWQILLKAKSQEAISDLLEPVIFGRPAAGGVKIELEARQ